MKSVTKNETLTKYTTTLIAYLLAVIPVFSTSPLSCPPPSFCDWALFPVESGIDIYTYIVYIVGIYNGYWQIQQYIHYTI